MSTVVVRFAGRGEKSLTLRSAALGEGANGSVWQASDHMETPFALKVIRLSGDEQAQLRIRSDFGREVTALASVNHLNVVRLHDHGETDDFGRQGIKAALVILMEFVAGEPLRQLLGPRGMPFDQVRDVFREVCAGLDALHSTTPPILHRDIKPDNIVLDTQHRVRIVDLGLGRAMGPQGDLQTTSCAGTAWYMAPEQFRSGSPLTTRADLYAAALVAHEMLTGRRPLADAETLGDLYKLRSAPPQWKSLAPEGLQSFDAFFQRALRPKPEERFATAPDLWKEFEECARSVSPSTPRAVASAPAAMVRSPRLVRWEDFRDEFTEALRIERDEVREDLLRRGLGRPLVARDGERQHLSEEGAEFTCRLEESSGHDELTRDPIVEEAPFQAQLDGRGGYRGRAIAFDPVTRELRLWIDGGDPDASFREAAIHFDATFTLDKLITRLEQTPHTSFNLHLALGCLRGHGVAAALPTGAHLVGEELDASQSLAARQAAASSITYLWGPPGTGKTKTLSAIIGTLASAQARCLIVAPTNAAVDELLLRCAESPDPAMRALVADGRLHRVGHQSARVRASAVSLDAALEAAARATDMERVRSIKALWRDWTKATSRRSSQTPSLRAMVRQLLHRDDCPDTGAHGLKALAGWLSSLEASLLPRARIVATTLTMATVREDLGAFDAVIIDEVSMALTPQVALLAGLARQRVIVGGDFRQLPPVHVSGHPLVKQWLGTDIFQVAGMASVTDTPALRPMLSRQYRMHPEISRIVGRLFYGGRLTDGTTIDRQYPAYAHGRLPPAGDHALFLIDTTATAPISERLHGGSRRNRRHAALVADLITEAVAVGHDSIGVITPYSAQVGAIRDELRRRRIATDGVRVSTVHRFQGQEQDTIILDTTDAPPLPVNFLDERMHQGAARLVNVAISRARRRLVVLAHRSLLSASLAHDSPLLQLLGLMTARHAECDDADEIAARARAFFGGLMLELARTPVAAHVAVLHPGMRVRAAGMDGVIVRVGAEDFLMAVNGQQHSVRRDRVEEYLIDGTWRAP